MYLQILNYIAIFFILLFLAFFCYALNVKLLIRLWKIASIKEQNKKEKKEFVKKQLEKGLKPYPFDQDNTTIYAKSGNRALLDKKRLVQEAKRERNRLKKY